ncbi:MAG: hypothetical protein ACTSUJ_09245 [Candidatus Njordarchaeales archaeon]
MVRLVSSHHSHMTYSRYIRIILALPLLIYLLLLTLFALAIVGLPILSFSVFCSFIFFSAITISIPDKTSSFISMIGLLIISILLALLLLFSLGFIAIIIGLTHHLPILYGITMFLWTALLELKFGKKDIVLPFKTGELIILFAIPSLAVIISAYWRASIYRFWTPDEAIYLLRAHLLLNEKIFLPATANFSRITAYWKGRWLWISLLSISILLFQDPFVINYISVALITLGAYGILLVILERRHCFLSLILMIPLITCPIILIISSFLLPDTLYAGLALSSTFYLLRSFEIIPQTLNRSSSYIRVDYRSFAISVLIMAWSLLAKLNLTLPLTFLFVLLFLYVKMKKRILSKWFLRFTRIVIYVVFFYEIFIDLPFTLYDFFEIKVVPFQWIALSGKLLIFGSILTSFFALFYPHPRRFSKPIYSNPPTQLLFNFEVLLEPPIFTYFSIASLLYLLEFIVSKAPNTIEGGLSKIHERVLQVVTLSGLIIGYLFHTTWNMWWDIQRNLLFILVLTYLIGVAWLLQLFTDVGGIPNLDFHSFLSFLSKNIRFIAIASLLYLIENTVVESHKGNLFIFNMVRPISYLNALLISVFLFYIVLVSYTLLSIGWNRLKVRLPCIQRLLNKHLLLGFFLLVLIIASMLNNFNVLRIASGNSYYIHTDDAYHLDKVREFIHQNAAGSIILTNIYSLLSDYSARSDFIILTYPFINEEAKLLFSLNLSTYIINHTAPAVTWPLYVYGISATFMHFINNFLNATLVFYDSQFKIYRINGKPLKISNLQKKIHVSFKFFNFSNIEILIKLPSELKKSRLFVIITTIFFTRIFQLNPGNTTNGYGRILLEKSIKLPNGIKRFSPSYEAARYARVIILDANGSILYVGSHSVYSFTPLQLFISFIPILLLFIFLLSPAPIALLSKINKFPSLQFF